LTGLRRSLPQIHAFLKKSFRCLKACGIPAKADVEKQNEFIQQTMEPVIAETRKNKCVLYYMDAAHFVRARLILPDLL
jgi:hypothetical protein